MSILNSYTRIVRMYRKHHINEFVICASAYQPWLDKIPGSTGGGRHYCINRNNTWWDYSNDFWDYQARAAYLMRQGMQQTDLCIYLGDDAPVKILTHRLPEIPGGYDFDAFTGHALATRMAVRDGRITLPDGHSYRMMVLPRSGRISLPALRRIHRFVEQGATIFGPRPVLYGSRSDVAEGREFDQLVAHLWGPEGTAEGDRTFGKGRVFSGISLEEALRRAAIRPDVSLETGNVKDRMVYYVHRRSSDADLYFLDNHKDAVEDNTFHFAADRKFAQVWDLVSGKRYRAAGHCQSGEGYALDLTLAPRQSLVVVLADHDEPLPVWGEPAMQQVLPLDTGWTVAFDEKLGGPGAVPFNRLTDWTENEDDRIKYYSGTAVYTRDFDMEDVPTEATLAIETPGSVAKVWVNGVEVGTVWCAPWELSITGHLKRGHNHVEIHVANSLNNRMVYDAGLDEKDRVTYAYPPIAKETDPLAPSGLTDVKIMYEAR